MQHYRNYQTTDFVLDTDFQQWVRHPTQQSDAYWQNVRLLFPQQEKSIEDARQILLSIKTSQLDRKDIPEEKMLDTVLERIHAGRRHAGQQQVSKHWIRRPVWVGIAASVALLPE